MTPTAADSMPTILNVDDDEGCRYAITRILEHNHFRVREARSGNEALAMTRSECPDLVLLDVNLPDINGIEVCRILKSEPATSRIPILHITASYTRGVERALGLESGADSYLIEPVEPEVLIATINSTLRTRRAEEAARALARQWQATFEAIADGVAVIDEQGRIQRLNGSLARLLNRSREELQEMAAHKLWSALPEEKQPLFLAMKSGRRETVELEHENRTLHVLVDPVFSESGQPAGAVEIVRDVTDHRRLEEQFRETQKFETIGTLAAGVAHDFNNLLTSIMGNASLIASELPEASPLAGKVEDILSASHRAADLTRQLLAYSGKGRHFMQKVDLSAVVERTRELIEAGIPKKVSVAFRLAAGLPRIEADSNQVQQVLLNLVSNAAEAIGEGVGAIEIETGSRGGDEVFLQVRDNGCGMDAETKSRMFDPFFTTKFTGRGLGLAAVAGIARGHKASIQVISAPVEGSTFRVIFPAEHAAAAVAAAAKVAAGAVSLLVVDDEEMVRRIAQATLEIRGYRVLLAADGLDAIEQARQHPEIQLVLLDLTMPLMGGEEAMDQIAALLPDVKVIISTGYDSREAAGRFVHEQVAGFLQKPYTSRQLAEKIQAVLAKPDAASA